MDVFAGSTKAPLQYSCFIVSRSQKGILLVTAINLSSLETRGRGRPRSEIRRS